MQISSASSHICCAGLCATVAQPSIIPWYGMWTRIPAVPVALVAAPVQMTTCCMPGSVVLPSLCCGWHRHIVLSQDRLRLQHITLVLRLTSLAGGVPPVDLTCGYLRISAAAAVSDILGLCYVSFQSHAGLHLLIGTRSHSPVC